MLKIEKIVIVLVAIGILLKHFHLPGSSLILILCLTIVSGLYAYFGFAFFNHIPLRTILKKEAYNHTNYKRIIGAIGTGLALSIVVVSVLFKVLSWPGAAAMAIIGLAGAVVILIVVLTKWKQKSDPYYSRIIVRGVAWGILAIFLFSIPTKTWLQWQYPNHPDYIKAVLDAESDPTNQELRERVDQERDKMFDKSIE